MVRRTRPNWDDYRHVQSGAPFADAVPFLHETLTNCALRPLRGSRKVSRKSLGATVAGLLEGVELVPSTRFRETPHPIREGSSEPDSPRLAALLALPLCGRGPRAMYS